MLVVLEAFGLRPICNMERSRGRRVVIADYVSFTLRITPHGVSFAFRSCLRDSPLGGFFLHQYRHLHI